MAKKKKKKKASPAQQKSKVVVVNAPRVRAEIVKQLSANACRKAMAQAEKLGASTVYFDADDAPLCSMACEFAIRELLQNGNEKALRASLGRIRNVHPEWMQQWPMALRVLGEDIQLTGEALADPSFRQAIRGSLRDPDELKYCSHAATREDVACIQKAVAWVKQMDYRTAATALKSIGRHSLLIDWRLYVQAQIADQLNDQSALSANLQRMQPDAPITSLAKQLFTDEVEYAEAAAASYDCVRQARSKRIKPRLMRLLASIAGQDVDTAMRQVADECDQLVSDGRISLAVMLMVAAYSELNYGHERMAPMLRERYESTDPRQYWRYCLRCIRADDREDGMSWVEEAEGTFQALGVRNWSRYERAKLVLDFLKLMKEVTEQAYGNDVQNFFDDSGYGYEECLMMVYIGVESWPSLSALFEMWIWMDDLKCPGQSHALEVWHKLVPNNVDVLERYIHEQARRRQFRQVDRLLNKLQRMPGAKDTWRKCTAFVLMLQAEVAMKIDDRETVLSLAARGNELEVFSQWQQLQLLAWNALTADEEQEEDDIRKELFDRAGNPWLVLLLFAITEAVDSPDDLPRAMDDELDELLIPQNAAEADDIARQLLKAVEQIDVSKHNALQDSVISFHVESLLEELETPEMICRMLELLLLDSIDPQHVEFSYETQCLELSAQLIGQPEWASWGLCFQAVLILASLEKQREDDRQNLEMLCVMKSYAGMLIRIASMLDDTDAAHQQLVKRIGYIYQLNEFPLTVPKRSINKIVKLHKKAVNAGQLLEAIMAGTPELVKLLEKQGKNETRKRKK